jgi:hypothetical protein
MISKILNEFKFRQRSRKLHSSNLAKYVQLNESIPRVSGADRVVVTFTTIPERINSVDVMLKSLLDQSVRPDKIYLCIPKKSRLEPHHYSIPNWLHTISILEILYIEDDLGPITKLIPALEREKLYPSTRIIVVDDDGVYPKNLVETLVNWSYRLPDAALGCSGVLVPKGLRPSDILLTPSHWHKSLRYTPKTSSSITRVDYLFGYAGVLVQPRFFAEGIKNYEGAPKAAFFEDDLWISGNLKKQGVERFVITSDSEKMMPGSCYKTLHTRALCLSENKDGKNMDDVFSHLFN